MKRTLEDCCSAFYLIQRGFTNKVNQVGGIANANGAYNLTQINLYREYRKHRSILGKLMYLAANIPGYDCDASVCQIFN